jgi:hypothetical protein
MPDSDYFGPFMNRAARVMAAGHGGQILLAASTTALADSVDLVDLVDLREHPRCDLFGTGPAHSDDGTGARSRCFDTKLIRSRDPCDARRGDLGEAVQWLVRGRAPESP